MSGDEKATVYVRTERYRKKNTELYAKASNKYYHANKEACAERAKSWRSRNKDYIREKQRLTKRKRKCEAIVYLGSVCATCGNTFHPAVYEFHHVDPTQKDRDPSKMLHLSWDRITVELDKCQLLCANCHRLTHHGGDDWDI